MRHDSKEGLDNRVGGSTQTKSFSIGTITESPDRGRLGSSWLGEITGLMKESSFPFPGECTSIDK
jgi:hypothetical protein